MIKRIIRSVFYLVAIALLFEVFARLDDLITYDAPFFRVYSYDTMLVDRDEFGSKGKANGRYEKWILNSHGFRGPEIQIERPKGLIRIVTFGASETFGLYESPGKEWPNQLRAALQTLYPDRKIEVINAARAGLSLESSKDYFEHRVLKFHPDIVLYYQGFSEYMDKDSLRPQKATIEQQQKLKARTSSREHSQGLMDLINQTRIYPKIKEAFKQKGPKRIVNWFQARNVQTIEARIDKERQIERIDHIQVDYYREKLKEFVSFLREHNITVLLAEHDVDLQCKGTYIVLWKYHPSVSADALRQGYPLLNNAIRTVARETGSLFVEQKSLLQNPAENFAEDGIHLTDKGAERLMQNFLPGLRTVLAGPIDRTEYRTAVRK